MATWEEREAKQRARRAKDHPSTHNCLTTGTHHGRQTDLWLMKVDQMIDAELPLISRAKARMLLEQRLLDDAMYWRTRKEEPDEGIGSERWVLLIMKYGLEMFDRVFDALVKENEELKSRNNDDYKMWAKNMNDLARQTGVPAAGRAAREIAT